MFHLLDYFVYQSTVFWVFLIIGSLALSVSLAKEDLGFFWPVTWFVLMVGPFTHSIFQHYEVSWTQFFLSVAIYLMVGVGWSLFKWNLRVQRAKDRISDLKAKIQTAIENKDERVERFTKSEATVLASRLVFTENKTTIGLWMAFWPWHLVSQGIKDLFEHLINTFAGCYKRLAANTLAELRDISQ